MASTLNSDIKYKFLVQKFSATENIHIELYLGNVKHCKECGLNHIFCQLWHKIFSGEQQRNQIQIYCLKLTGGEQKSLKLLEFIIQYNKKMRRKDMIRSLTANLWSIAFGNGISHYQCHKNPPMLWRIHNSFIMGGKNNQKINFWFPLFCVSF